MFGLFRQLYFSDRILTRLHPKVEVVSVPNSELATRFSQVVQSFVDNCCILPQEGETWEHSSKPKLILVSSDEVLLKVLEAVSGMTEV